MKIKDYKKKVGRYVLKIVVIVICLFGFLFQTSQFMFLFQTYPTVVDIQVSVPTEIEAPGITFCNPNGMNLEAICRWNRCTRSRMLLFVDLCPLFWEFCKNGTVIPPGFTIVRFDRLTKNVDLTNSSLNEMRMPWEDFFKCTIFTGIGSAPRKCDLDSIVLGSYYSETNLPSFCFTMNTRWGDPKRKIQKIKKSERINLQFYMDISYRNRSAADDLIQLPMYSPADAPTSVQIAVHSSDMTLSPYIFGKGFFGGKNYRIKLKKNENHLLPSPYQTNCTDYLKDWTARDGIAPLNQFMAVQECRMNAFVEDLGCVPYDVDFPHNYTLCRFCSLCENRTSGKNCNDVLSRYNQPCQSSEYLMSIEELWVYDVRTLENKYMVEPEHNCTGQNMFMKKCQITEIEIDFDEFQITNISYIPKYENLEVFSVVGGYMGMYLGISLVAIYDFLETAAVVFLKRYCMKKKIKKQMMKIAVIDHSKSHQHLNGLRKRNANSAWEYTVY